MSADRHFYLYARGWYEKGDLKQDLKIIHSHWSGVAFEDLDINYPISRLLVLVEKHIKNRFYYFMGDVRANYIGKTPWNPDGQDLNTAIINACLSVLKFCDPKEIGFDIGEPDTAILSRPTHVIQGCLCFGI